MNETWMAARIGKSPTKLVRLTWTNTSYNTTTQPVAAPGRQGSQVIWTHFQVTKVMRQVNRCKRQHSKGARSFRGQKILKPGHLIFLVIAFKTQAANADCFTVKIKQIKQPDMVAFLFSVCTITKAKQQAQGGARVVDLTAMSFDLTHPGVAPPLNSTRNSMIPGYQHTEKYWRKECHNETAKFTYHILDEWQLSCWR